MHKNEGNTNAIPITRKNLSQNEWGGGGVEVDKVVAMAKVMGEGGE
jgi:hypothetical protein